MEEILAIIFVLGVPSLALATRFIVRPLMQEYARLKGLGFERDELVERIGRLEDIVHGIDQQVDRLVEAERFRRELESGRRDRPALPEG